ncbi:MAG: hypothetical protein KJT01_04610 [Gemmatimonadetes bacterium]|nr:hypothetical protein [Gemmatimonadota bacterium]
MRTVTPPVRRLPARTAAAVATALVGFVALASSAGAQGSISVTYQGPVNAGNPLASYAGGPLGPLNMQRNTPTSIFQAYCIDFDNAVSVGQTWTARVVSIATLATSQTDFNAFVKTLGTAATAGTLGSTFDAATTQ